MAKQIGVINITGCYGNISFYKLNREYYARIKSSLSGERVKKDPVFSETMRYAELMRISSPIASQLYRSLPKENRSRSVYQQLTGEIMKMIKEGVTKEEIIKITGPSKRS